MAEGTTSINSVKGNNGSYVNSGILNNYTVRPKNLTQYTALRGVVDFSQIGQFDQFETGYSFLSVIKMPRFIEMLAQYDDGVAQMANSFKHMLEYEFRGMTGLPNITSNTFTITDGSNEQQMINDVVMETSVELTSNYFERSGSLITKFAEYYLTGIKDPKSKAKTYHGLIKHGLLAPSLENEVFTFMYYVTDNTYLRLEKAYLLANVQLTQAETSMYDSEKGQIQNKEIGINFRCFPITGTQVDKAAKAMLEDITGDTVNAIDSQGNVMYSVFKNKNVAALDSADYNYAILDGNSVMSHGANQVLAQAIDTTNKGPEELRKNNQADQDTDEKAIEQFNGIWRPNN